ADGDGNEDWAEEPGEKERDARGSYCWHVLSLRRHDPDQVQRVPAVWTGRVSQLLYRSSPRNTRECRPAGAGVNACGAAAAVQWIGGASSAACRPMRRLADVA